MIQFKEPPRLCEKEDVPRELRNWLERARSDGLSAAATAQLIEAVKSRAMATTPSAGGPTDTASPSTAGAGSSTTPLVAKLLAAVATIGFGVGVGYLLQHHRSQPALSSSQVTAPEQTSVAPSTPQAAPLVPLDLDDDSTGSESTATSVTQPTRTQTRTTPMRAAHSSDSPAAPANDQKQAAPSVSADPASARADEYRLLRTARRELSSSPGQALELTKEHTKQFPNGTLIQEREAIAIEALMRLGRSGEAKSRASRFLSQFPASPYRSHLTELVSPSDQRGPAQ